MPSLAVESALATQLVQTLEGLTPSIPFAAAVEDLDDYPPVIELLDNEEEAEGEEEDEEGYAAFSRHDSFMVGLGAVRLDCFCRPLPLLPLQALACVLFLLLFRACMVSRRFFCFAVEAKDEGLICTSPAYAEY